MFSRRGHDTFPRYPAASCLHTDTECLSFLLPAFRLPLLSLFCSVEIKHKPRAAFGTIQQSRVAMRYLNKYCCTEGRVSQQRRDAAGLTTMTTSSTTTLTSGWRPYSSFPREDRSQSIGYRRLGGAMISYTSSLLLCRVLGVLLKKIYCRT